MARRLGKSRTSVTESLSLNGIPEEVKNLCRLADINSKSLLLQVVRQGDPQKMVALVGGARPPAGGRDPTPRAPLPSREITRRSGSGRGTAFEEAPRSLASLASRCSYTFDHGVAPGKSPTSSRVPSLNGIPEALKTLSAGRLSPKSLLQVVRPSNGALVERSPGRRLNDAQSRAPGTAQPSRGKPHSATRRAVHTTKHARPWLN